MQLENIMSSTDNYDKTLGLIFVLLAFIVIMTIFVAAFFLYARLCLGFGVERGYPIKDDDFSFFKGRVPTFAGPNQTFSKSFTYHIASSPIPPSPARVKLLNLLSEAQPISTPKLWLNTSNRNDNAYAVNIPTINPNEIVHDMEFFEIDSETSSVSMSSTQSGVNWFHAIKDKISQNQQYKKCSESETSDSYDEIEEYTPRKTTKRRIEYTKTIGRIRRQLTKEFDFTISTL
ncbi:Oidioi.mRNA.OKI2018_I69.chr2.g8330.t1.cds [Oikopleura dioica]|uniref:Oidioi.mRNA.OKI2018_I69.chr2.g8330.t1.cds n=1 Tax=Oikopleura dioica TaxID=34765 RepID=A0ABN7TF44_OIKDI|nr:Oidioi.mRNA.OKI2018_I69.chr2.g8330.t1.cds [Oikopleura dioica]